MSATSRYRKYNESEKGRARSRRYLQSEGGVIMRHLIEQREDRKMLGRLYMQRLKAAQNG